MDVTVFDCREQLPEQIVAGQIKAAAGALEVKSLGSDQFFERFRVIRDKGALEVVRFFNFGFCGCKAFQFTGTCRHIAATFPALCSKCFEHSWAFGRKCTSCEMAETPYLKPVLAPKNPRVKIGGIWV